VHLLVLILNICVLICQANVTVAEERLMEVYHVRTVIVGTLSNVPVPH
jgi:hypothetical protein